MDIKLTSAFLALTAGCTGIDQMTGASQTWLGTGVYLFGHYRLDLDKWEESWIPARLSDVTDCSDKTFFCLRTADRTLGVANLIVPKRCGHYRRGQRWMLGDVETVVVETIGASPFRQDRVYLLRSENTADNIFEYRPAAGIVSIFRPEGTESVKAAYARRTRTNQPFGLLSSGRPLLACRSGR